MDWADLPALLAVARTGSFAGAARSLKVNGTTISRRIGALEEGTGTRLIESDRDGARLTPSAEAIVARIEEMEGLAFEIERSLLGGDASLSGTLRVSTTDTIAHYESGLFTGFSDKYPDVALEVGTSYREQSLLRREADVAVRWTNQPEEALFGRKLVRSEYALFGHRRLVKEIGKRSALGKFPWVAWSQRSGARITEQWMKAHVPEARVVTRFDNALSMHAAVFAGAGVAFLPCAFAAVEPDVVRLRKVEPSFGYDLWCLTHPDLSGTARVRAFLSHAGDYFKNKQQLYAGRLTDRKQRRAT